MFLLSLIATSTHVLARGSDDVPQHVDVATISAFEKAGGEYGVFTRNAYSTHWEFQPHEISQQMGFMRGIGGMEHPLFQVVGFQFPNGADHLPIDLSKLPKVAVPFGIDLELRTYKESELPTEEERNRQFFPLREADLNGVSFQENLNLFIVHTDRIDRDTLDELTGLKNLEVLHLNAGNIERSVFEVLSDAKGLRELAIPATNIPMLPQDVTSRLTAFSTTTPKYFFNNKQSLEFQAKENNYPWNLRNISNMSHLERLCIDHLPIRAVSSIDWSKLTRLQSVEIGGYSDNSNTWDSINSGQTATKRVGNRSIPADSDEVQLMRELCKCVGLTTVVFPSRKHPHSLHELATLKSLKTLILAAELDEIVAEGISKLSGLQTLEFRECSSDKNLVTLGHLEHLHHLKMMSFNNQTGAKGIGFANLKKLRSLEITSAQISAEGLRSIGKLQYLESLMLMAPQTGLSGVELSNANLPNIKAMYLYTQGLDDAGCAEISRLTSLRQLALGSISFDGNKSTVLSSTGVEALGSLKNLTTLAISGSNARFDRPVQLQGLSNLRSLMLSGNMNDEFLASIAQLQNLERLALGANFVDPGKQSNLALGPMGLAELSKIPNLKSLNYKQSQSDILKRFSQVPGLQMTKEMREQVTKTCLTDSETKAILKILSLETYNGKPIAELK